ncbi:MAG: permease [Candidatus Omnitrophica bacterium]|nr:permease [Candidatus Omnitrophota bacterium]
MATDPICGMQADEKTSPKIFYENREYFFCSQRCAKKFIQEHHLSEGQIIVPEKKTRSFLKNKTVVVSFVLALMIALSFILPILEPFRKSFGMYFKTIWWAVLIGLLIGGVIDYFIPREYISSALSTSKRQSIIRAVILGFFMSVCSHGILALSIQLHKKGASTPSVVAFLLASPWANLPLTIMLIGFFGLAQALYIILVAIFIAIVTGFIFQFLESKGLVEKNINSVELASDFSITKDMKKRFKEYQWSTKQLKEDVKGIYRGAVSLSNMVLWWILIGMGMASLAGAYIPEGFFYQYMGPTVLGLFVTLAVATVLEVCSEGTAPLAFEIFRQTGALGNSFVFLMAGVATDYTEIGLLWHNVGRKTAIWLPVVTVPQIIVFGILANIIF